MFKRKITQAKVQIPKEIRDMLNVKEGDTVAFEIIIFNDKRIVQLTTTNFMPMTVIRSGPDNYLKVKEK